MEESEFRRGIEEACWNKLHAQHYYLELFRTSALLFSHYYEYEEKRIDAGFQWLVNMWEHFRRFIQNGYKEA